MTIEPDANWWNFALDAEHRASSGESRLHGDADVNPSLPGGLRRLDYHTYLGLDRLLASQRPSSTVPDERAFIVTHQLMEVVFKLMVFDAAVVEATLRRFEWHDKRPDEMLEFAARDEDWWLPAMTASARMAFSCREVLPAVMRYLADPKDADETFSSIEFYRFRENLEPASGFQSAQFRLLQRALGKSNLLSVRLFPAQTYRKFYGDETGDTVRVVDPVILRDDAQVASPASGWLKRAADLDDTAHKALSRLAQDDDASIAVDPIHESEVDRAAMLLERIILSRRPQAGANGAALFRTDLEAAAKRENERRIGLKRARAGAIALRKRAPSGPLHRILSRIASADDALHGTGQDSFLSVHLRVTRERLRQVRAFAAKEGAPEPTIGTGGGGIEYLGWSQRYLVPLFPALVAYRELGD